MRLSAKSEYDDSLAALLDQHKVKTVLALLLTLRTLSAEAAMYKAEADKLTKRAKAASKAVEFYNGYLLGQMVKAGQSEAGEGVHTAKIQKGSKRCETNGDLDEKWFSTKTVTAPNKTIITRAIKAGETIEGAWLAAGPDTLKIN